LTVYVILLIQNFILFNWIFYIVRLSSFPIHFGEIKKLLMLFFFCFSFFKRGIFETGYSKNMSWIIVLPDIRSNIEYLMSHFIQYPVSENFTIGASLIFTIVLIIQYELSTILLLHQIALIFASLSEFQHLVTLKMDSLRQAQKWEWFISWCANNKVSLRRRWNRRHR